MNPTQKTKGKVINTAKIINKKLIAELNNQNLTLTIDELPPTKRDQFPAGTFRIKAKFLNSTFKAIFNSQDPAFSLQVVLDNYELMADVGKKYLKDFINETWESNKAHFLKQIELNKDLEKEREK